MTRLHRLAFAFVLAWPLPLSAQPGLAARIDPIFAGYARAGAPGCAVGVARAGEPLFSKGYGTAVLEEGRPITTGTGFNLGSVAKQFTALAVLLLEQRGRLSLDDDVRRYVPELPHYGVPIRVLDEYAGTFYSADVGNAWTVARTGTQLAVERTGHPDAMLTPIAPDLFMADIGSAGRMFQIGIRFMPVNGAAVEAFTVTALPTYEVVRDLRFDRIRP